jgi:hypothetical protein
MTIDLVAIKQAAGVDYNPDQEGLDLFANLIIDACAKHLLDTSDRHRREYFAEKLLELKNDI